MTTRVGGRDVTAPMAWILTGSGSKGAAWRTQRPVLDLAKCTGCLICWKFCPEPAIAPEGDKVRLELGACKGCGVCVHECPAKALTMTPEAQ